MKLWKTLVTISLAAFSQLQGSSCRALAIYHYLAQNQQASTPHVGFPSILGLGLAELRRRDGFGSSFGKHKDSATCRDPC
jgi:hypothetical protein